MFRFCVVVWLIAICTGCTGKLYDPAWATQPYPQEAHSTSTVDMQVFRRDTIIEIINSTPRSYSDFDLWINQRYVQHVDSLTAGQSITLSLWDFYDEYGDRFNAGGFFRAYTPTPVRLVQIHPAQGQPMIGLVTIRSEPIALPPQPGR
jgi:hypothetical protein